MRSGSASHGRTDAQATHPNEVHLKVGSPYGTRRTLADHSYRCSRFSVRWSVSSVRSSLARAHRHKPGSQRVISSNPKNTTMPTRGLSARTQCHWSSSSRRGIFCVSAKAAGDERSVPQPNTADRCAQEYTMTMVIRNLTRSRTQVARPVISYA